MGPVLAALFLIGLGAIAGSVVAAAIAFRGLPDAILAAAIPDKLIDDHVSSLRGTWAGYFAQKVVAFSRSRLLGLIWKGSWAPLVAITITIALLSGAVYGCAYFELLSWQIGAFCVGIPALQFGTLVTLLAWLAVRTISTVLAKLRDASIQKISLQFKGTPPAGEKSS
jgi:hypothetical protein